LWHTWWDDKYKSRVGKPHIIGSHGRSRPRWTNDETDLEEEVRNLADLIKLDKIQFNERVL
jgi:hypothetical protein